MSEREKIIGARLRAFREMLQIPRSRFSVSVGYASERLAAYEAGRARLPYCVFRAVAQRYGLYPGWLAEGTGPPEAPDSFDETDFTYKISSRTLFTEVYDKYLAKQLRSRAAAARRAEEEDLIKLQKLMEVLNDETIPWQSRSQAVLKIRGTVEELARSSNKGSGARDRARRLKKKLGERKNRRPGFPRVIGNE
jgi:transcriptional regulator with XRE-family HTH domain